MAKTGVNKLSPREQQIVDALFQMGEASAAQVRAAMTDAPSYSAVRTLLRILEEKGAVTHYEEGRKYIYRPKGSPKRLGKDALRRVVDVFFGGSLENALAAHLSDAKTALSPEEVARLRDLIDQADSERTK